MKGFPRRGSDWSPGGLRGRSSTGLNEGLPQKGKRCGSFRCTRRTRTCLNEGLPQKGKRFQGHQGHGVVGKPQ